MNNSFWNEGYEAKLAGKSVSDNPYEADDIFGRMWLRGLNSTSRKPRGLAAVSPERRKEIATMGGKAVQAKGKAFKLDSASGTAAVNKRWAKKEQAK